jgi:CheY-like chemotaxis protein
MRVLVIDDERSLLRVVERVLRADHEIALAESAEEALSVLASGTRFDAIVCDLRLRGMDGLEFAEQLEPHDAARVVFTTGAILHEDTVAGHPVLAKPFTSAELIRSLEQLGVAEHTRPDA